MKQTTRNQILAIAIVPLLAIGAVRCGSNKDDSLGGEIKTKAPITEPAQVISNPGQSKIDPAKCVAERKIRLDGIAKIDAEIRELANSLVGLNYSIGLEAVDGGMLSIKSERNKVAKKLDEAKEKRARWKREVDELYSAKETQKELTSGCWAEGPCGYVPTTGCTGLTKLQ